MPEMFILFIIMIPLFTASYHPRVCKRVTNKKTLFSGGRMTACLVVINLGVVLMTFVTSQSAHSYSGICLRKHL